MKHKDWKYRGLHWFISIIMMGICVVILWANNSTLARYVYYLVIAQYFVVYGFFLWWEWLDRYRSENDNPLRQELILKTRILGVTSIACLLAAGYFVFFRSEGISNYVGIILAVVSLIIIHRARRLELRLKDEVK